MVDAVIVVPCPECWQRIRGSVERVNEMAICPCGHRFRWNANSLRSPIPPPPKSIEPWGWPIGPGSLLCAAAVCGFLSERRSSSLQVPFALLAIGIGLFVLNAIRTRLARSMAEHRYQHWALMAGLADLVKTLGIPAQVVGHPTCFDIFFTDTPIVDYRAALTNDVARLKRFKEACLRGGVLKGVTKIYVSCAHTEANVERTLAVFKAALTGSRAQYLLWPGRIASRSSRKSPS